MNTELISLSNEITREHEAACQAAQSALEHARRAGELLIEAKAHVDHGVWLPWLAEHCPTIPERTAQAYMRIARRWTELEAGSNAQRVADLSVRQALALLGDQLDATDRANEDSLDLRALRREQAEIERRHVMAIAELRVLERALAAPDLAIDEATAVAQRAEALIGEWHRVNILSLADLGRWLLRVRAEFGDDLADAVAADWDSVKRLAEKRISELETELA